MPKHIQHLMISALAIATAFAVVGCSAEPTEQPATTEPAATETPAEETAPAQETAPAEEVTELKVEDLVVGDGAEAVAGKMVSVHYTGWLTDGTKFDSSVDRGQPFQFALGAGQVIPGWDQGVAGMKVGGKRKLTIPSDLAYGDAGSPPVIPGGATLVFEVELLGVQ